MTRDRRDHQGQGSTASRTGAGTEAMPGKRTRVECYGDMIASLGVTRSQPLFAEAAWEPIQRQEDPAVLVAEQQAKLSLIEATAARATTAELRALAEQIESVRTQPAAVTDAQARGGLEAQIASAQDALVRRFQALAAYHADQTLQAWHDPATTEGQRTAQRTQYLKETGWPGADSANEDWCGMFANTQFRAAGFAPELNLVFNHSENIAEFFSYGGHTGRMPPSIIPHGIGEPIAVRDYHEQRGSLRSWKTGGDIGHDIRPGDIVAVDWEGNGGADHVFIVASYTPDPSGEGGRLVSIDGNSYGAKKTGGESPRFDGTDAMASEALTSETSDVSTSQYVRTGDDTFDRSAMLPDGVGHPTMTMLGRGRPSLVDFETGHQYPPLPMAPRVTPTARAVTCRAGDPARETGAVATGDPAAAFDAATAGGSGEVPYRDEMQRRLGADFSSVQAYTGRDLAPLGARAATRGDQVTFAEANPDKEVVAHELTHVLQSRQGRAGGAAVSDPGDASEHEAREVASAVTAGENPAVTGAPSAAIHRQEDGEQREANVPDPVHPDIGGNRQDVPIDWGATHYFIGDNYRLPGSNTQPGSIGEVREFFLLRYLASELPEFTADYPIPDESERTLPGRYLRHDAVVELTSRIEARMQELLATGVTADADEAERIRIRLFAANEHALSEALLIPGSTRHTPIPNDKDQDTWCNVYAFDVVTAMGGYLPRTWWTTDALTDIAAGEDVSVGRTTQVDANGLYAWMLAWGVTQFGWDQVATAEEAQREADLGQLVIILGSTGDKEVAGPGHVSVVMTRTATLQPPTTAETADPATPEVPGPFVPLQSQAGAVNYSTNASGEQVARIGRRAWWSDGVYADLAGSGFGFFVYRADRANRGFGDLAVPTPEAMGTILPQPPAS